MRENQQQSSPQTLAETAVLMQMPGQCRQTKSLLEKSRNRVSSLIQGIERKKNT
jgi:hypothetical protein